MAIVRSAWRGERTAQPEGRSSMAALIYRLPWQLMLVCFICLTILSSATASLGDRSTEFQNCLGKCRLDGECSLSLPLRLMQWTCDDNCKYECMMSIVTNNAGDQVDSDLIMPKSKIHQYYGKWPFIRFLGMQEPASVLFSLLNGYVHIYGLQAFYRRHIYLRSLQLYSISAINAWLWSAVFHTRDTPFTEKMDYFSAALTILCACYYAFIRIFGIRSYGSLILLSVAFVFVFVRHVHYLTTNPRFDFEYNMMFNVAVGSTHSVLWLIWALRHYTNNPATSRLCLACVVGISLAMSLELFDFPPLWWILDAHSLWHAATIPLSILWYRFLTVDQIHLKWM